MSKFTKLQEAVFSILSSSAWQNEAIVTIPSDMHLEPLPSEFVRVTILSDGSSLNNLSISGLLIMEIFTPANQGPKRASLIADKLDQLFSNRTVLNGLRTTQFGSTSLRPDGPDKVVKTLTKSTLSVSVNHFGVL
jgi:hypothetical protein